MNRQIFFNFGEQKDDRITFLRSSKFKLKFSVARKFTALAEHGEQGLLFE